MKMLSLPCILIVFILTVLVDWYYAYAVIFQPGMVMTAWAVIFPFLSVFYFVFGSIAVVAMYQHKPWSFQSASFAIVFGSIFSTLSYGLSYKSFPLVEDIYTAILVWNFIALIYLGIFYFSKME